LLIINPDSPSKIGAVSLSSATIANGSTTMTVASTASLGAIGSVWVLNGPFVDANTTGTVASATTITLSSAATGTGSFPYTARQNSYSAVTTGAATQSSGPCSSFPSTVPDDDVWYKFVAVAADQTIAVSGKGGFDPVITVTQGACAQPTLDCINSTGANAVELATLTGLTPGVTYHFRVYHAGIG
jgi:hypothetical protein